MKDDKQIIKKASKRQGYISAICFLIVFFSAFILIRNVMISLEDFYRVKFSEFQALKNLATYDIRADLYAALDAASKTVLAFDEEVFINGNRIYLDETGEIYFQRGE
ncbi:MAG: hypothetical protein ACOC34_05880 [Thermotogota bacterium]